MKRIKSQNKLEKVKDLFSNEILNSKKNMQCFFNKKAQCGR